MTFRSPEMAAPSEEPTIEKKDTLKPKVEFEWERHIKADWEKSKDNDLISECQSLIISGPEGEVDILKLTGIRKISLQTEGTSGGYCQPLSGEVVINKFNHLGDLAVLLHELGHAQQADSEKFNPEIFRLFAEIIMPQEEGEGERRSETFRSLIRIFPQIIDIVKSPSFNEAQAEEIAKLPIKIIERDATAKALRWFRQISKETGLDFFKKFQTEGEYDWVRDMENENDCQTSIREGVFNPNNLETATETTVVQELNRALESYRAGTLSKTYDPADTGQRINVINPDNR